MTTILVDLRHGILVADAFQEHLGHMRVLSGSKSAVLAGGDIAAWSGRHEQGIEWLDWLIGGQRPKDKPDLNDASGLLLKRNGSCFLYMDRCVPIPIHEPYYAIGSGAEFVLGAMRILETRHHKGHVEKAAHAVEAMRVACHFDTYTAYPLTVYDIKTDGPTLVQGV